MLKAEAKPERAESPRRGHADKPAIERRRRALQADRMLSGSGAAGNLSRAAEEMYLTQPTLTARLKALEEELGDPLFVRTSRGMRVTEAGREFLPYAERIV